MSSNCCNRGGKHKKIWTIVAGALLALAIILVGAVGVRSEFAGRAGMMGGRSGSFGQGRSMSINNITYAVPTPVNGPDQFVAPQDAAESGELAITVGNIDTAKKAVSDIAASNSGNVYATFISYSSNNIKNGSMVVQVPVENFDATFAALHNVGMQVVQESTQQIEQRVVYPMMQPDAVNANTTAPASAQQEKNIPTPKQPNGSTSANATNVAPSIAIAPYPQVAQDKGYIRVVFADYGASQNVGNQNIPAAGGITSFQNGSENSQKVLWIGFVVKVLLLLVMLGLLAYVFRKMVRSLRLAKPSGNKVYTRLSEKKTVAHVVRAPRARIINTKKR